jgi:hypothetical protein
MRKHLLALTLALSACSTTGTTPAGAGATDAAATLTASANQLTNTAMGDAAPALSAATQKLPVAAQALVQSGYAALTAAVDQAEKTGVQGLTASEQNEALDVLNKITGIADALHVAIH